MNPDLTDKSEAFEKFTQEHLLDDNGLVLSWIDATTNKPFARAVFDSGGDRMRHPPALQAEDFGLYFAYENCGMCTGAWLAMQTVKHRVTREAKSLESARSAFEAIRNLYRISQDIAPGFLSKFHEGKLSPEISTDQCLYVAWGIDQFSAFATMEERREIAVILAGMANFWKDRNYSHPYRERDFEWEWPLNRFPPLLWLAWRHTGDSKYRDEFLRLISLDNVRNTPPFFSTTQALWRQEGSSKKSHWPFALEQTAQGQLSLEPMLRYDAPERELWLSQLRELVTAGMPGLTEECLQRGHFSYDETTGIAKEVETSFYSGGKPNPIWEAKYFVSGARSGHSPTMFARALISAEAYLPGFGWKDRGQEILKNITLDNMLFKIDPNDHLPTNQKWLTRCLCGDAIVNWLWAYWLALEQE